MHKEKALLLYKNQPALVLKTEGGKITVELPKKGKAPAETKNIREKDAFLLSEAPVPSMEAVLNAALPDFEIQPEEAASFFSDESPAFRELCELLWGALSPEQTWAAWQAVSGSPWFVCENPEACVSIRSAEEVARETALRGEKEKKERERAEFFGRLRNTAQGKPGGIRLPEDAEFLQDAEALALGKSEKSAALRGAGLPETPETAHSILLKSGFWNREKNVWPSRKGMGFAGASSPIAPPPAADDDTREDLTYMEAFAIDNEWSDDPDDAVCVHDGKLWIHIADPAASVTHGSPADREAMGRGTTLYLPEGAVRMLADDALPLFALGLSKQSRALSFGITLTETGAVRDVEIKRSFVTVTRMSYGQADAERESPKLAPLYEIAERNFRRRIQAGAVQIDLPEVKISVASSGETSGKVPAVTDASNTDASGTDISDTEASRTGNPAGRVRFFPVQHTESSAMVREMMLLAGEAAARFAFKHAIPFPYISQEEPAMPQNLPGGYAGEYAKRRCMKARKTGTIPADHAGLGLGMYSQVTSPLRRYGDLAAHQQLRRFLAGEPLLSADEMTEKIAQGDAAGRLCVQAERASNMHWTINYLLDHPGWEGDAVVVETNGAECTVLIPELGLEARTACPAGAELNSVIRVKAGAADIVSLNPAIFPNS